MMLLAGTRPEAVKLAPLARALGGHEVLRPVIVHSGQHDGMVEQALAPFGLLVDMWLHTPPCGTDRPAEVVAGLLPALDDTFRRYRPAALVVQGDTATVLAGALAAFWAGIPVVHLEAGMRTHDLNGAFWGYDPQTSHRGKPPYPLPFPEEGIRQMVSRIAALHLAPTTTAAAALRAEGIPRQQITLVGNTVVDAVQLITQRDLPARCPELALLEMEVAEAGQRLILIAAHRRESWGAPLGRILSAVRRLVEEHDDVQVLFPVDPGPAVRDQVIGALGDLPRVTITEPLDYPDLIRALRLATLVLTDAVGIQEEAPTFGTPVLVLRDTTERREAVDEGYAWLVGTDSDTIHLAATEVLIGRLAPPHRENPYGDGKAAVRAVIALEDLLGIAEGYYPSAVPASET